MVIGEHFAWVHVPKTAGDATWTMFHAVPGLVRSADPLDSNRKHRAFWESEDEVAGKLRVMNIRRLPAWALSAAQHKAGSGLHPDFRPLPLDSAEQMIESTDPDDMLRWMTDGERFAVERWLRAESLADDVVALLSELGELTPEAERRVRAVGRVNEQRYDHDLARWFTPEQVRRIYARNPDWAGIELELYGSLVEL
jgi:hypothetical protein